MSLNQLSNAELLMRMQKLVRTERKITHLVLLYISEIETRKIYADQGYDGIYSFLTKELGYSEGAAYRRMQAARLLRQVPTVAEKLENGSLNLSQLTKVQKCLNEKRQQGESLSQEQTLSVLQKLENQNAFATQKTLARELDLPIEVSEKIKPQQNDTVRIELTLTAEQFANLETAKSLLSHICPNGAWAEVIATLAQKFNQQKLKGKSQAALTYEIGEGSPVVSVQNGNQGETTCDCKMLDGEACEDSSAIGLTMDCSKVCGADGNKVAVASTHRAEVANYRSKKRNYLSVHLKRLLLQKANHQCEYRDKRTNKQCVSKYQLEVEHCQPLALGGSDDLSNLRIYCRTHNILAARKSGLLFKAF